MAALKDSASQSWTNGMMHGIDWQNEYWMAWFLGVPLSYLLIAGLFRGCGWLDFKLKVLKGNRVEASTTRASDFLAFEIVAGACVLYLAAAGFIIQFSLFGVEDMSLLEADFFYADSKFMRHHIIFPMISYQLWNALLCLIMETLNDRSMILHHLSTASLAYLGLHPYLHHTAVYFLGIAEASNIPLTVYDVCKKFESRGWKDTQVFQVAQITFAVSFIVFRLILWPYKCYPLYMGCIQLIAAHKAHNNIVAIWFLACNVFLSGLQVLWGYKIVVGLLQFLGVVRKASKKEK